LKDTRSPSSESAIDDLLARPLDQRIREYKYRLAQALVFGLPVIFLQYVGPHLGGAESERWVGVLQAILAGWIVYVGAAGMTFEGAILLGRRRMTLEFAVAVTAVGLFLYSAASVTGVIVRGQLWYRPLLFHWMVVLLAAWCGWRWSRLAAPRAGQARTRDD
jgi:cation transport ATPase